MVIGMTARARAAREARRRYLERVTVRLEILPFVATSVPGRPFVLVEGQSHMISMSFMNEKQLADPRLGQLVRESGAGAVVLDVARIDYSVEDVTWVTRVWPPMLASPGVQK